MTTLTNRQSKDELTTGQWATLGLVAAVSAIIAVWIALTLARALWPEIALFQPLSSYPRAAIFTLVPALLATGLFAWLAGRRAEPAASFTRIAIVVLLLSFIPDYLLPDPNRTILASTVAASLHVVAAIVIVGVLIRGYGQFSTS